MEFEINQGAKEDPTPEDPWYVIVDGMNIAQC